MINPYETLGIKSNATEQEVKNAYRNLAKKYHPDNSETGDDVKFREINEAYNQIKNPDKYNNQNSGFNPFHNFRSDSRFNQFFKRMMSFNHTITITLDEYINGSTHYIPFQNERIQIVIEPKHNTSRPIIIEKHINNVDIEIIVSLNINYGKISKYSPKLYRDNDEITLIYTVPIHLLESIIGTEKLISSYDEQDIKLKIPENYKGSILRIPSKGLVGKDGNNLPLYIKCDVYYEPIEMTKEDIKKIRPTIKKYIKA